MKSFQLIHDSTGQNQNGTTQPVSRKPLVQASRVGRKTLGKWEPGDVAQGFHSYTKGNHPRDHVLRDPGGVSISTPGAPPGFQPPLHTDCRWWQCEQLRTESR